LAILPAWFKLVIENDSWEGVDVDVSIIQMR
jgi:hypothetical protein